MLRPRWKNSERGFLSYIYVRKRGICRKEATWQLSICVKYNTYNWNAGTLHNRVLWLITVQSQKSSSQMVPCPLPRQNEAKSQMCLNHALLSNCWEKSCWQKCSRDNSCKVIYGHTSSLFGRGSSLNGVRLTLS
jgi:hypothetical protein